MSSASIAARSMTDADDSPFLNQDHLQSRLKHLEDLSPQSIITRPCPTAIESIHRTRPTNGAIPLRSSSLPLPQSPLRHCYRAPPHIATKSPLRGTGFGESVLVEHDDDTPLVGSPASLISSPPVTTASSSTVIISHSTRPLNTPDKTLTGSPALLPLLPISANYASTSSPSPVSPLGPISPPSRDMVPDWDPFVCPSTKSTSDLMPAPRSDESALPLLGPSQTFRSNPIPQESGDSMPVDGGYNISMELPVVNRQKVCLSSSSSSKWIFGDTTTLHMPVPHRIHACPSILEHEFASVERPLRCAGFGNGVPLKDDNTSLAGHSAPSITSPPVITASSSTNPSSRSSHPLDAYGHLSRSLLSQSSSFPVSPNPSKISSLTPWFPSLAQMQTPTNPVQGPPPPVQTVATTRDASLTHHSSSNQFYFMGPDRAALVQSPTSWTQGHEDAQWRPEEPAHEGNPPAPTSRSGQESAFAQHRNPIGLMDLDMPHPIRAWSRPRASSHRKPPARPRRESPSSVGMFTNAQVKEISGGIFHNVAHIYESDSPAPGGGLAFQFAALSLQAVFFALLSFLLPTNSAFRNGIPVNQPPRTATTLIPPLLRDDDHHGSTHVMAPHRDGDPVEGR